MMLCPAHRHFGKLFNRMLFSVYNVGYFML